MFAGAKNPCSIYMHEVQKLLKDDQRMYTCRAIIFHLGQVASFKDHHRKSVGSWLVTQGEQELATSWRLLQCEGDLNRK